MRFSSKTSSASPTPTSSKKWFSLNRNKSDINTRNIVTRASPDNMASNHRRSDCSSSAAMDNLILTQAIEFDLLAKTSNVDSKVTFIYDKIHDILANIQSVDNKFKNIIECLDEQDSLTPNIHDDVKEIKNKIDILQNTIYKFQKNINTVNDKMDYILSANLELNRVTISNGEKLAKIESDVSDIKKNIQRCNIL